MKFCEGSKKMSFTNTTFFYRGSSSTLPQENGQLVVGPFPTVTVGGSQNDEVMNDLKRLVRVSSLIHLYATSSLIDTNTRQTGSPVERTRTFFSLP